MCVCGGGERGEREEGVIARKRRKRKTGEKRGEKTGKEEKGREIFGKGLVFEVIWREMTCKIRE